jgi:hypothetical protein
MECFYPNDKLHPYLLGIAKKPVIIKVWPSGAFSTLLKSWWGTKWTQEPKPMLRILRGKELGSDRIGQNKLSLTVNASWTRGLRYRLIQSQCMQIDGAVFVSTRCNTNSCDSFPIDSVLFFVFYGRSVLSLLVYSELALKSESNKRLLQWAYLGPFPPYYSLCEQWYCWESYVNCVRQTDRQGKGIRVKEPNYILR